MLKLPNEADVPVPVLPASVYDVQMIAGLGLLRVVDSCISSAAPSLVMVAVYVMVAPGSR
jgi:hypothetical protein